MSVQLLTEINKLNNIQFSLEKSLNIIFQHLSKYDNNIAESDMISESEGEKNRLQVLVNDIYVPLKAKIKLLQTNKLHEIKDFSQFKKEMIGIQENIQNLKSSTKAQIDLLKNEEDKLEENLNFYTNKVHEWSKPIKTDLMHNINGLKLKTFKKTHIQKEVKEFMDFVHASGGHENGWTREDHQLFLKIRSKYKHVNKIVEHLNFVLPDISELEIKVHVEWYKHYIVLNNKKKEAIKRWQERKLKTEKNIKLINSHKLQLKQTLQHQPNLEEKLQEWKDKKKALIQNDTEMQLQKIQTHKELEENRKKRYAELKKLVSEWKKSRLQKEECLKLEKEIAELNEKKIRSIEANKMIKHYQYQDDLYVMRMKQTRKHVKKDNDFKKKSCEIGKRDPERLLKPTKQWLNRINEGENIVNAFATVNFIKNVPKLSVPDWRQKITS